MKGTRGQSLVEFGLILPVLLLLVLGAIDFGRLFFAYVSVTNAARNGAQYGSFSLATMDDEDGIRAASLEDTTNLLNTSATNPLVTTEDCGDADDDDDQGRLCVRVKVDYTFETLFPWPGLPNSIDMSRTVQMRVGELPP